MWERFHSASKAQAEFVQPEDTEYCLHCESMRVVMVMGVVVAQAWLLPPAPSAMTRPQVVQSIPAPSAWEDYAHQNMWEDCVRQNISEPALLPGCEDLR